MPHLHNDPGQHDFTTSAFIVRTDGPEPAVILHLHKKLGLYFQFGGHVELNETPWQGLLREMREESGYDPDQLTVLQPPGLLLKHWPGTADHPLPYSLNTHRFKKEADHFHSDICFALVASEPPRHEPAAGESAVIKLVTAAGLRAMPSSEIVEQTRDTAIFLLEHTLNEWQTYPTSEWPA